MDDTVATNLIFDDDKRDWVFKPRDGRMSYINEDKLHFLKAVQPLCVKAGDPDRLVEAAPYLVVKDKAAIKLGDLVPPLLHFGWRIDTDKFMDVVRSNFANCIEIYVATDKKLRSVDHWNFDLDHEQDADDVQVERVEGESAYLTAHDSGLEAYISDRLQLPDDEGERFKIHTLCNGPQLDQKLTIVVGTNFSGVMEKKWRDKVRALFNLAEYEGKWWLDPSVWRWARKATAAEVEEAQIQALHELRCNQ
ncbi:hypothetical protein PENSPDRAFT_651906 [Peniophora sp. CONT]|nr:hypothetical protein PENSPDRAFT_651906 [Peniophora sp. CONT]